MFSWAGCLACPFHAGASRAQTLLAYRRTRLTANEPNLVKLQETRQYLTLWDKILAPRSQAWSAMDFFLALLPEGHGSDLRALEICD